MAARTKTQPSIESPYYLHDLEHLFEVDEPGKLPKLIGADDSERKLTTEVATAMHDAIRSLRTGATTQPAEESEHLSTQQAADALGVLLPYLIQLLDEGKIPFFVAGSQQRIRRDDLMAYKAVRDRERREALRELTQLSQELGLYDVE
jgi:excisionase family DNA binding protein